MPTTMLTSTARLVLSLSVQIAATFIQNMYSICIRYMSHPFILHQFEVFNCSTFQNFRDDLKTLVSTRMVHEVTVKVTAGVKDIRDGRKTVNMIYCLMENFPLGVHFLYQCTLQLAGLYFCVVKRVISEYVLNFR